MLTTLVLFCGLLQAPPPADQHLSFKSHNLSLNVDGGWFLWHDGCDERSVAVGRILERDGGRVLVAETDGGFYWPAPFPAGSGRDGLWGMGWVDAVGLIPADGGVLARVRVLEVDPHWPGRISKLAQPPFEIRFEEGWQCPKCGMLGPESFGPCPTYEAPAFVVPRQVTIAGRDAVVFPGRLAAAFLESVLFERDSNAPLRRSRVAAGAPITGYFTPDDRCIAKLEGLLERFLKRQSGSRAALAAKQRGYRAQYAGFRAPEQKLFASYLCREVPNWEWTGYPYVHIGGGGDCYFQLVFDCERGSITDFTIEPSR